MRSHTDGEPAATTRERCFEVELRLAEGRGDVEEIDRKPNLAAEQLPGRDVDRARGLERADRVDAAGGEMAERERERAHDAQAVGELGDRRRVRARRAR